MLEILGFILAFTGFVLGISGSWYVSHTTNGQRKKGFGLWICGNPISAIVIIGVMLGLWSGLPLIFMLLSTTYYWFTAVRGWKNNDS
jgi:hypothetical protein